MFSTRFASVADAGLISSLSRRTFLETFAEHNTTENMDKFFRDVFSESLLMAEVGVTGNTFLLIFFNYFPAGYALIRNESNAGLTNAIEIARIYIVREYLGKGAGKKLMMECLDFARSLNKKTVWLGVWEKNQRAIDFYRHFGFTKFGTHVFMLGEDPQTDLLMKLHLD